LVRNLSTLLLLLLQNGVQHSLISRFHCQMQAEDKLS